MSDLDEYHALVAKVGAFTDAVAHRRAEDLACRRGCDACCKVELTVSPVEAASIRRHLAALPAEVRASLPKRALGDGCAMLDASSTCTIYDARPLVCRTQGHALRYAPGSLVRAHGGDDVTWCELNYTARAPAGEDVLDAERVDTMLAVVSRRFAERRGEDPLGRVALRVLAASARDDDDPAQGGPPTLPPTKSAC